MRELLDLILPRECGGCHRPGSQWCPVCSAALTAEPIRLCPRLDPQVPVWALGAYTDVRRRAVINLKERGRRDLAVPLGHALAGAMLQLRAWGELDPPQLAPLRLVPGPTRTLAARRRGGDPVTSMAAAAVSALAAEGAAVAPVLRFGRGVRDSVGLSAPQRQANVFGRVALRTGGLAFLADGPPCVVFVDDVLTTGATARESVRVLGGAGIRVHAVLVLAGA